MSHPVALRRHIGYDDPDAVLASMRALLAPLGGFGAFAASGARVLLKPNLVMGLPPQRAVNTHPSVVRALAALAREAGAARLALGDSPGYGAGRAAASKAGYDVLMREFDVEWSEFTPADRANPDGLFKTLVLARELSGFDLVVNLPKLKTHAQMTLTAAAKNLFGCVPGYRKIEWHYRADRDVKLFGRILFELARAVDARLTVVDAIVGMDGPGPTAGKPNPTGFLAAGADPFAVDAVLLRILGKPPETYPPLAAAIAAGRIDWRDAPVVGDAPEHCRPARWDWPRLRTLRMQGEWLDKRVPRLSDWLRRQLTAKPEAGSACVGCGYCVDICPVKALDWTPGSAPAPRLDACIRCYCCHELCPSAAMRLAPGGWLGRLLGIGRGDGAAAGVPKPEASAQGGIEPGAGGEKGR